MTWTLRRLAALTVTAALAITLGAGIAACGPANGSPNCPPGQWWVDKPGYGWECSGPVFVPTVFTPSPGSGGAQ